MHKYEVLFIIRPDTPEDEVAKLATQMEGFITAAGGTVVKVEKMGRRKLAYRVQRHREGFYVLVETEAPAAAVRELERRLKVADAVIKFLTVRVDEEQKRAEKLAAIRARRQAKRPKKEPAAEPHAHEEAGEAPPADTTQA